MSDERGHRLALILQAIESEERHFALLRTEHKELIERLQDQLYKLRQEILTGQIDLLDVMQVVADQVNGGALNTKDVKVTAEVKS